MKGKEVKIDIKNILKVKTLPIQIKTAQKILKFLIFN